MLIVIVDIIYVYYIYVLIKCVSVVFPGVSSCVSMVFLHGNTVSLETHYVFPTSRVIVGLLEYGYISELVM